MAEHARSTMPVAVVTGGGGGIGAAIAEELGRRGTYVVTMDPLVSLDGAERLPEPEETTAGRIVAAGGAARASSTSVTDREAVQELFAGLVDELGRLDAVVNVAGITRPTAFASGAEQDWMDVLSVHLDGYRNVLDAALPLMAAAGRGHILGVTSGSGWRAADTGAYGCAKRAVASLTWQLGRHAPAGVVVNAVSPIAVTRMVTAALGRRRGEGGKAPSTGGLSLDALPAPDELGPLGAHLVADGFCACNGQVIFAGGSEVAVVEEPRLLEVVRTDDVGSLAHVLDVVGPAALASAEADQATGGGSNPRFGAVFSQERPGDPAPAGGWTCAVAVADPELAAAAVAALEARGASCTRVDTSQLGDGFEGPARCLASVVERDGPPDAVVVGPGRGVSHPTADGWARVLSEHDGLVDQIAADAAWARAVADLADRAGRPVRLVTVTDATTAGGRSRAQATAQLSRAARRATEGRVAAFSIGVESADAGSARAVGELVAHLACSADAPALSGAELVTGAGWLGVRSHPRPGTSASYGGPAVPGWLDDVLRSVAGSRRRDEEPR